MPKHCLISFTNDDALIWMLEMYVKCLNPALRVALEVFLYSLFTCQTACPSDFLKLDQYLKILQIPKVKMLVHLNYTAVEGITLAYRSGVIFQCF